MKLVTRSEFGWGATRAKSASPTKGLVLHYDGTNQGLAVKPHIECIRYWKNTRAFHTKTRRWVDIGYSFGCCPHGYIFEGRGLYKQQAAQPGGNSTHYSCTLMSGPKESPTNAQVNAVKELHHWLMDKGVAKTIKGHRDFVATECPGDRIYQMIQWGKFYGRPRGEDEMSAKDIWTWDGLPVPDDYAKKDQNPKWRPDTYLRVIAQRIGDVKSEVKLLRETNKTLLEILSSHHKNIDADEVVRRVEETLEQVFFQIVVEREDEDVQNS